MNCHYCHVEIKSYPCETCNYDPNRPKPKSLTTEIEELKQRVIDLESNK